MASCSTRGSPRILWPHEYNSAAMRPVPSYFYPILLLSLLFGACADDTDELIDVTPAGPTLSGDAVEAGFTGRVTAADGTPLPGVTVSAGTASAVTDAEAAYALPRASVVADRASLTFRAEGYVTGSRTLLVREGSDYVADVELLSLRDFALVDGRRGGEVEAAGTPEAAVAFPADAFARADGSGFGGVATVAVHYLDPTDEAFARQMPGDLRSVSDAGDVEALASFGMVSAVIRDDRGAEADLAEGKTATLRIPVADELRGRAPATIPLYYFDETRATWVAEGAAALTGGAYVGEVSHFTFWSASLRQPGIKLCGQLFALRGGDTTAVSRGTVLAQAEGFPRATAPTNDAGQFCGIVPANTAVTLSAFSPCEGYVEVAQVPPTASDVELGAIAYAPTDRVSVTVTGQLTCASGAIAEDAIVRVRVGEEGAFQKTRPEPDGSYAITVGACGGGKVYVNVGYLDPRVGGTTVLERVFDDAAEVDAGETELCGDGGNQPSNARFEAMIGVDTTHSIAATIVATDRGITVEGTGSVNYDTIARGAFALSLPLSEEDYLREGSHTIGANGVYYPVGRGDYRYSVRGQTLTIVSYKPAADGAAASIEAFVEYFTGTGSDGESTDLFFSFEGNLE